jgi:nucleolar protein 4
VCISLLHRLVVDKVSGKAKGTAFVEFQGEEGAKKAADACARGR